MVASEATLAERVRASAWIAGEPGLADAVAAWEAEVGAARLTLADAAVDATRPGPPSASRLLRHATALGVSRAIRIPSRLPTELRDLTPLRQTDRWVREAGAEAFADQLAMGGAASAEVARLIVSARRLFPHDIAEELARRAISPPPMDVARTHQLVAATFPEVLALNHQPVAALPTGQLHRARLHGGRDVLARVRRPGIARQLVDDARLSGTVMTPLQQLAPQMGGMAPLGLIQLTTRHGLEATDLRFEALNLVELGLIVEEAGAEGLSVARPLPGAADRRVLLTDPPDGVPIGWQGRRPDPQLAAAAVIALTLEPALTHGLFWADPAPEHLLVTPEGGLALVGVGAAGHLSPALRQAGIRFLAAIVSGDAEGQVEAMRVAGAVPSGADVDALLSDLRTAENLQVSRILMGGEAGLLAGLRDATHIMLAHDLQPPLEVVMLLRTVFALGELLEVVAPDGGGLMAGLMPLMAKLPQILADLD